MDDYQYYDNSSYAIPDDSVEIPESWDEIEAEYQDAVVQDHVTADQNVNELPPVQQDSIDYTFDRSYLNQTISSTNSVSNEPSIIGPSRNVPSMIDPNYKNIATSNSIIKAPIQKIGPEWNGASSKGSASKTTSSLNVVPLPDGYVIPKGMGGAAMKV